MAGAAIADIANGPNEPVMGAGGARDDEAVGLGIPNRATGAFPTVAGAGFAGVLGVEIVAVDGDVVPHRRGSLVRSARLHRHDAGRLAECLWRLPFGRGRLTT